MTKCRLLMLRCQLVSPSFDSSYFVQITDHIVANELDNAPQALPLNPLQTPGRRTETIGPCRKRHHQRTSSAQPSTGRSTMFSPLEALGASFELHRFLRASSLPGRSTSVLCRLSVHCRQQNSMKNAAFPCFSWRS